MTDFKDVLLTELPLISPMDTGFEKIRGTYWVERITARAALIGRIPHYGSIENIWVPKSLLRCDGEGNLYVADWFYRRNF